MIGYKDRSLKIPKGIGLFLYPASCLSFLGKYVSFENSFTFVTFLTTEYALKYAQLSIFVLFRQKYTY